MRVDVYHHWLEAPHGVEEKLQRILDRVVGLGLQGAQIMATNDEALKVVGEIKASVEDVADDIGKLIVLAQNQGVSDDVMSALTSVNDRLKGVAAQFPPVA